jgi:hypothetical protein
MRFVDHCKEILGEIIDQRKGRITGGPPAEMPRIILYAMAVIELLQHLHIEPCAFFYPPGFDNLALFEKFLN